MEEKVVVIDDVWSIYMILFDIELLLCLKWYGYFCFIDKFFYFVNLGYLCVIRIFLNDFLGIVKLCLVFVENNVVDLNVVNLCEGKWLIIFFKLLNFNVKCGEKIIGKRVKSLKDIVNLG